MVKVSKRGISLSIIDHASVTNQSSALMVASQHLLLFLAISLNTSVIMAPPLQPGGISGSLNWWKDNSFNSPSSDYLYQSFRTKVKKILFL